MGIPKRPKPVKIFSSIIYRNSSSLEHPISELKASIGEIEEITEEMPFIHTHYYENEMGSDLRRRFVLFKGLVEREELFKIKLLTNEIEKRHSLDGKRLINIDPGYISLENVILFTTKNYTHRIYLSRGIFADLTLIFRQGSYNALTWTYPDYKSKEIISMFNLWRKKYKNDLNMGVTCCEA